MSGFVCPDCGSEHDIFGSGGGEQIARELDLEVLGRIPIEPGVRAGGDAGVPITSAQYPGCETSAAATALRQVARTVAGTGQRARRAGRGRQRSGRTALNGRDRPAVTEVRDVPGRGIARSESDGDTARMRIAVIADIHANLPALRAVLDDIARIGADSIYCVGDVVGRGPHPNE